MNVNNIVHSNTGAVHLCFALLAMLFGAIVLSRPKGTNIHKKLGYLYTLSMLGMLVTSFMIYNLYGKFGIFHWLALLSSFTLISGLVPVLLKWPKGYISYHFNFMFWSVMGLYAAFVAELLVRLPVVIVDSGIPNSTFYNLVGVGVAIVMFGAVFIMRRKKEDWETFDKSIKSKT